MGLNKCRGAPSEARLLENTKRQPRLIPRLLPMTVEALLQLIAYDSHLQDNSRLFSQTICKPPQDNEDRFRYRLHVCSSYFLQKKYPNLLKGAWLKSINFLINSNQATSTGKEASSSQLLIENSLKS